MMEGLLTQEEREKLGTFEEGNRGDYHEMLHYLDTLLDEGLKNGRFTREEVEQDLEMALWVAYACNNIDTYEHYYLSVQWLARVEEQARQAGSGVWHYRYACALLYCGRPEKALEYAEKGVRAQPAYPWCWLLLARLRSHFGDRKGALQANAQGLLLKPGDYEFLRQERDLRRGCTLEELENHYVDEEADRPLGEGKRYGGDRREAVAGILCRRDRLEQVKLLLGIRDWKPDSPYCTGLIPCLGRWVEAVFRMNEAAVSKMSLESLRQLLRELPGREAEERDQIEREQGIPADRLSLSQLVFSRNRSVNLVFSLDREEEPPRQLSILS